MEINDFLKKAKVPSGPAAPKKKATPKEDEAVVITRILSTEGENVMIDYNGVPFGVAKKDIVDVDSCGGLGDAMEIGQPVQLIVKKECELDCKLKIKVGELIPKLITL